MDAHTAMEEWEVSPFDGGFEGLRELRSGRFSGAVEAGTAWLFLRDGDPLAVVEDLAVDPRPGDVGAFEDASGRAHRAPNPAAASLAAMLALDGDVRGQYFTDETSLARVHETLSEGGFTGYVELSENVMSGDYYVVYEDGAEDHLGYIGSSGRLVTDDEAETKAKGEVGIYSVVAVGLPNIEIPAAGTASGTAGGPVGDPEPSATPDPEDPPADEPVGSTEPSPVGDPEPTGGAATDAGPGSVSEPEEVPEAGGAPDTDSDPDPNPDPDPDTAAETRQATQSEPPDAVDPSGSTAPAAEDGDEESVLAGVTTRAVPSLDPDRTGRADSSGRSSDASTAGGSSEASASPSTGTSASNDAADPDPERSSAGAPDAEPRSSADGRPEPDDGRIEAVREEYEDRIEDLRSELASLREERDRLEERVRSLESAHSNGGATGAVLSPAEALAGTSLFVREGTRGEATLEDAHAGRTDRETLEQNLHIEYHTQFEDDGATVDGEAFEAWLRSSAAHEFVEWLIVDLLFEIRSTGSGNSMAPLYDAIPEIDRIGFDDTVTVGDGQEGREIGFDVVARDRMGDPLVVANIDESRDPTRADAMGPLIADAGDVCEDHDSLAGTFAVTSSYFEPDALDAAREATSGSLLGREKYRSYVKLARKNGFHLCLVESREGSFHLAAPEL